MTRYLLIPGIHADLGSVDGWHLRLACDIMQKGRGFALPFGYGVHALNHQIWLDKHCRQLADLACRFANPGDEIRYLAHSHGCNIALESLRRNPGIGVSRLELIAPAVEADCDKNGLNEIMNRQQVGRVRVWMPTADDALDLADLLPVLGFGFDVLGKHGPKNMPPSVAAFVTTCHPAGGHSEMFAPARWGETFDKLTEE